LADIVNSKEVTKYRVGPYGTKLKWFFLKKTIHLLLHLHH
jgi:hypothetical protein